MKKVNTTITLDPNLKAQAQQLFAELGLDLSSAIAVFLKQAVRQQALPFKVSCQDYNDETLAAIAEVEIMKQDKEYEKHYASYEQFIKEAVSAYRKANPEF